MSTNYNSTTTLARIRAARPCEDGWRKLLAHVGKTAADDEPLSLVTVLDSNGLDHAIWVLSFAMPDDRLERHFQAWCVERVLHLFEVERPHDSRVRDQIAMLRRDDATLGERGVASAAARDAARDAAFAAARDAADASRSVLTAAAWLAARAAAWDAASAAARAAARATARIESGAAAWDDARAIAWGAARADQERQLRAMIEGEK